MLQCSAGPIKSKQLPGIMLYRACRAMYQQHMTQEVQNLLEGYRIGDLVNSPPQQSFCLVKGCVKCLLDLRLLVRISLCMHTLYADIHICLNNPCSTYLMQHFEQARHHSVMCLLSNQSSAFLLLICTGPAAAPPCHLLILLPKMLRLEIHHQTQLPSCSSSIPQPLPSLLTHTSALKLRAKSNSYLLIGRSIPPAGGRRPVCK